MNKKGFELSMFMVASIFIVVLTGSLAISKAVTFADKDYSFKENTVQNIQLMVNTLVGVPGDVIIEYPLNVSEYNFILRQNSVVMFDKGDLESAWVEDSFFLPNSYFASGSLEEKARLCLFKENKNIFLRECENEEGTS
jgi:hypothetical protein